MLVENWLPIGFLHSITHQTLGSWNFRRKRLNFFCNVFVGMRTKLTRSEEMRACTITPAGLFSLCKFHYSIYGLCTGADNSGSRTTEGLTGQENRSRPVA